MHRSKQKRPRLGVAAPSRGLSKTTHHSGDFSMKRNVTRIRCTRKPKSLPLFEWADSHRRLIGRPTVAERLLRSHGYSDSVARLIASQAGFPVEGD